MRASRAPYLAGQTYHVSQFEEITIACTHIGELF
jgi:hypothetical protein